ncbi:S1 family peptidase [Streptomyces nigrescens]|nr:S1 family peptidase [Streptomyces nigrescens]
MKNQETLDKLAGDITRGLSESERAKIPGFTDIHVDPERNHLRLFWKGAPSQRVRHILAHLPSGVTAEVVPARYSKQELHQARNKMLRNGKPVALRVDSRSAPVRVTSIGPSPDGSSLEVGYDEDRGRGRRDATDPLSRGDRRERSAAVKRLTDRMTGIKTVATYQPLSEDLSATTGNRQHDSSPWFGASALRNPGGGICSGSFSVRNRDGDHLLMAARHCSRGGNGIWRTWEGGDVVGGNDAAEVSIPDDAQGIRLPSGQAGPYLYDGPATRRDGYAKPVVGWGHNNVGDYVCADGANSGIHCNVRVAKTDVGIVGGDGSYRPLTDLAYATGLTPGGVAAVNGDSGGPVFAGVNNYTADEARGMITALDRTVTCPASLNKDTVLDGHIRTPWCLQGVYYVPVYQTLHDTGWTLVTLSMK